VPETVAARVFLASINTVRAIRDNQLANGEAYAQSVAARARVNALRASEELARRVSEAPAELTTSELIKLAESSHALQQDQQQADAPQVLQAEGSIKIHFGREKNHKIIDITPAVTGAELDS
jgi:tRNA C32,U32 (ribose-2'-O)-methylase TrmJ